MNNLGLIISSCYLLLTVGLKAITFFKFKEALELQGYEYLEIETKPAPFNTILWTANVELEEAYLIGDYSFFDSENVIDFKAFPKNHHYLGEWKEHETIKRLIKITNGWYIITEREGFLYFNDLRFGQINPYAEDSEFAFSYKLVPENGELRVEEVEKTRGDAKAMLSDLWKRLRGN